MDVVVGCLSYEKGGGQHALFFSFFFCVFSIDKGSDSAGELARALIRLCGCMRRWLWIAVVEGEGTHKGKQYR